MSTADQPSQPTAAEPLVPPPPPIAAQPAPEATGPAAPAAGAPAPGQPHPQPYPQVPVFPNGKPRLDAAGNPVSPKSRLAAALLCWFFGVIGIHRFYVGKVGTGVLMIFTLGGLGVWVLVDFIMILLGSFRDKEELPLQNW